MAITNLYYTTNGPHALITWLMDKPEKNRDFILHFRLKGFLYCGVSVTVCGIFCPSVLSIVNGNWYTSLIVVML